MPIENRSVSCDVCHAIQVETEFNIGWPGWSQIQGIGAYEPGDNESIQSRHLETWLCPTCKEPVSEFINKMQTEYGEPQ